MDNPWVVGKVTRIGKNRQRLRQFKSLCRGHRDTNGQSTSRSES